MKALISLVAAAATTSALAGPDFYSQQSWYVTALIGRSVRVLGTQDLQSSFGLGIAFAKPEPRFQWHGTPAQLVIEGIFEHNRPEFTSSDVDSIGLTAYARFRFRVRGSTLYFDLGEGLQFASSRTSDLPSSLNSSPILGFGVAIRQRKEEILLGLRFQHISNAGTVKPNRGQNLVYFTIGHRF